MARLTITGNDKTLIDIPLDASGLVQYVRNPLNLRSTVDADIAFFGASLDAVQDVQTHVVQVQADVPLASVLSLRAGTLATLAVHPAGATLFKDSDARAGDAVVVPGGTTVVSVTFSVLVTGTAATTADMQLAFDAGTSFTYQFCHAVSAGSGSPTVADALTDLFTSAVFVVHSADLTRLRVGDIVSLAGTGTLTLSGKASLSATNTLLATPGLPLLGVAKVLQAGELSVAATYQASGAFEVRVSRPSDDLARLAFCRRPAGSLTVTAAATAGLSTDIDGKDWLAAFITSVSANPAADLTALRTAGVSEAQIADMQAAIQASISRSLSADAQLQLTGTGQSQSLFEYAITPSRLSPAESAAVTAALSGRLTDIGEAAAHGDAVSTVVSLVGTASGRKANWRLNLFGILNVSSLAELLARGSVTYEPISGTLSAADEIASTRIRVDARPLESAADKLRRLQFESVVATTAYQASRALGGSVSLTTRHGYVDQRSHARRADAAQYYQVIRGLWLCDVAEQDAQLATITDLGTTTFAVQTSLSADACDALYLDDAGAARPIEFYERIGRQCLVAVFPPDDQTYDYRRPLLENEAVWARARLLGNSIRDVLPEPFHSNDQAVALAEGDVVTILWWARAMSDAAAALVTMRQFLGARSALDLAGDDTFANAKARLSRALGSVASSSQARFDLPWDVLALDAASARRGRAEAHLVSPRLSVGYAETAARRAGEPPATRSVT